MWCRPTARCAARSAGEKTTPVRKQASRNREDHSPLGPWPSPADPESELAGHVKEMNILSAHRSSSPIWPASQCGLRAGSSERPPTGLLAVLMLLNDVLDDQLG